MTLFEELDTAFPAHSHFYSVSLPLNEALDRCARMTGDNGHVFSYNGMVVLAVQHGTGPDVPWLNEIPRPEAPSE
jgi:hypothetical protein